MRGLTRSGIVLGIVGAVVVVAVVVALVLAFWLITEDPWPIYCWEA